MNYNKWFYESEISKVILVFELLKIIEGIRKGQKIRAEREKNGDKPLFIEDFFCNPPESSEKLKEIYERAYKKQLLGYIDFKFLSNEDDDSILAKNITDFLGDGLLESVLIQKFKDFDEDIFIYEKIFRKEDLKEFVFKGQFEPIVSYKEFKEAIESDDYIWWNFNVIPHEEKLTKFLIEKIGHWRDNGMKSNCRNVIKTEKQIETVGEVLIKYQKNYGDEFLWDFSEKGSVILFPEVFMSLMYFIQEGVIELKSFYPIGTPALPSVEPTSYARFNIRILKNLPDVKNLNKTEVLLIWDLKNKNLKVNDKVIDCSKSQHQSDLLTILFEEEPLEHDLSFRELYDLLDPSGSLDSHKATKRYSNATNQLNGKIQKITGIESLLKTTRQLVKFNPKYNFIFQVVS